MSNWLPPGEYLPHDAPMMLLDAVCDVAKESAVCQVAVVAGGVLSPFLDANGNLPGWYALELMAQTIGVWSGWHRLQRGLDTIELGMVLGSRELVCAAGIFPAGATLTITINQLMQDERFGSFDCAITSAQGTLATGRVNTFQPGQEELISIFNQGPTA